MRPKYFTPTYKEYPVWKTSTIKLNSPNFILPHTNEAGDPYYIGDVYEPSRIGPSGELIERDDGSLKIYKEKNPAPMPYLRHLESLAQGWPQISYLADFMKVTTSPPKQRFLTDDDRRERASRTNVAILTFDPESPVHRVDYNTSADLSQACNKASDDHDDVHARLIVVEDLSRDVIEILGSRFDVNPNFFRSYISDYMWYNARDPWFEPLELDIMARKRSYFQMRYIQAQYFKDKETYHEARRQAGGFNVLRRVDKDGNWVRGIDIPDSDVGLIRSQMSLWIRPNKHGERGTLGILLVDPTISAGFPIWGGPLNLMECPAMTEDPVPSGPPRLSIFEDTIYYTSALTPEEVRKIPEDPRLLWKKSMLMVCTEYYTFANYATTRVAQLEWEVENPNIQRGQGGLQVTIDKLHRWRRRFPIARTLLADVLEKVIKREHVMDRTHNHVLDLQRDFEIVLSKLEDLQLRADRIMNVVTAVMSIEESRKAVDQNRSLARLTWLAVTFVPLSFTSSLFSMNAKLSTLVGTFRIFFAVALPLTAIVLFVTRFARNLT